MSTSNGANDRTIIIKNVRLSFPDLFTPTQFQGTGPATYKAAFLVEPGSANDKAIRAAILQAATAKWDKKAADILKTLEGNSQKCCYVDGNQKEYDGYAGKWALSTSRPSEAGAPKVIDRDPTRELTPIDGRPYGGCYVNAKVQLWAQDNQWGKGIRATLITVQFVADGDAFGGVGPATADGFEEVVDEAGDLV